MIRRLGLLCALQLLAGCSEAGAPVGSPPAEETPPSTPAAPTLAPGPAARPTGGVTGEVSALSGDRSDLNVRVTEFGVVVDLPSDALFEYDKADLTPAAEAELRKAAQLIVRSPPGDIQVIGHTDSHGDDAYNQTLSEARARAVADWFGAQVGVRRRTFQVSGRGESAPVAPNETPTGADDPQGRAKNRRVEVVLPNA